MEVHHGGFGCFARRSMRLGCGIGEEDHDGLAPAAIYNGAMRAEAQRWRRWAYRLSEV